jgi:hypothetical protein
MSQCVIPAEAGISAQAAETSCPEIPAFAGMTNLGWLAAGPAPEMPS